MTLVDIYKGDCFFIFGLIENEFEKCRFNFSEKGYKHKKLIYLTRQKTKNKQHP